MIIFYLLTGFQEVNEALEQVSRITIRVNSSTVPYKPALRTTLSAVSKQIKWLTESIHRWKENSMGLKSFNFIAYPLRIQKL